MVITWSIHTDEHTNQEYSITVECNQAFEYKDYFSKTIFPNTPNEYHMIFIIVESGTGSGGNSETISNAMLGSTSDMQLGINAEIAVIDLGSTTKGGPQSTQGSISKPNKGLPGVNNYPKD